mgnify:CR=1 FL=1
MIEVLRCTVNNKPVEVGIDPRESLADVLRERLGLTSVKKGCEVGECGACNVLIDGEAYNSCIYLAVWAEGKHIRTLEGCWALTASSATSSRPLWTRRPSSAASARRALS